MLVFAYGSNLDPMQMKARCPDVRKVGNAVLKGHRLCFPRLSERRRCGVSSVEAAKDHDVWGVVFELNEKDLATLDRFEGYQHGRPAAQNGYNRRPILVEIDGAGTEVQIYIATLSIDPPPPDAIYIGQIRCGARHHGLPDDYQARLALLAAVAMTKS